VSQLTDSTLAAVMGFAVPRTSRDNDIRFNEYVHERMDIR
jgi:hypothetical protein